MTGVSWLSSWGFEKVFLVESFPFLSSSFSSSFPFLLLVDSEDFQPVVPGAPAVEEEDMALKKARVWTILLLHSAVEKGKEAA